eukprot:scaffold34799_cov42-Cyclotella_meneghiniana.AAC.2
MRIPNVRKTEYLNVGLSGCHAKRTSGCVFLDIQICEAPTHQGLDWNALPARVSAGWILSSSRGKV